MDVKVFGQHDERVRAQLQRCADEGDASAAVLCADGHRGYSQPIGGVVAYEGQISPSGVGYDIGCGNKAVLTDLHSFSLHAKELGQIADEIDRRISFGVGRHNAEPADHDVLDHIRDAEFPGQRALLDLAAKQLGTVGAGNHYVDLLADEQERVWIGVHFGSRGFGHKTASGFLSLAQGGSFQDRWKEGEMDAPPTLLKDTTGLGQGYIAAMRLAGEYAYAGRDIVCETVLDILGARSLDEVHNHHNFAWREAHESRPLWVVRKGATPAFPGQRGFVGGSMGDDSVILEGVESRESKQALYSTVHGAGRQMSRTAAAGKQRKRWACTERDCDWVQPPRTHKPQSCPLCGTTKLTKRWVVERRGAIDWSAVTADLESRGIVLRGGAADEAPGAYKRLPEVLEHHAGTVRVLHTLRPLVVVMAGPDTADPYKD